MKRAVRWTAGVCAALSIAVASGCGSGKGDDPAPRPHTELITALSGVRDSFLTHYWSEFGDVAGVRARGAAENPDPLLGYGESQLVQAAAQLHDLTGIDPLAARTALTLGQPPEQVGVLNGTFDPSAIGAKLQKLGYKKRDVGGGEAEWVIRDNHAIDANDRFAQLGILTALNVIRVSPTRVVYAGATKDIDTKTLTGPRPLSDAFDVGAVADCLGPVKAAQIGMDINTSPKLMGIGVQTSSPQDATAVVCMVTKSRDAAEDIASAWPGRVQSVTSYLTNEPWSKVLADPKAEVLDGSEHVVRLTARPLGKVTALFDAWRAKDLGPLLTGTRPDPTVSAR
ncbi:hypothetical protein [Streptomyces sp. 4F14]|uniref:hypothetical protein n=1 Tax=Streptomyces sp. 4F14 TaxID=3394380 RepID=UPI003A89D305